MGWGGHTEYTYTYTYIECVHLSQSIAASSNFSFRIFFCAIFWHGIKCDGALVTPPCPLFERLADPDGRAVEMKGDGRVSVARILNSVKTNGI